MQRRAAYLLVLFWALALALVVPSHSISYAQKDDDKVPKTLLKEAKKAVGKVKKPDYAAVNAIRYLLNREQDVARLPFWRENLAIPSLGTTKVLPGEAYPKWLSIRLAALIRAGMTLDIELEAELKIFFETNVKTVFDAAAGTVEMLVIDAILNREEDGFSKWKNEARQRAGEIYKTRKWHDGEFGKAPDLDQVARFVDDLIARLAFQRNGFPKPEGSALEGARSLANFVLNGPQGKGVLWHAIDGGVETKDAEGKVTRTFNALPRAQGILMLLIANSLAAQIVEEGQAPIDLKAITPALSYHCRTLVIGDDKADYAGMCQEGATAVFTALVDESLLTFKGEKKPKKNRREEILKNALLTPASLYQTPKLSDMGLSYLLGWHPDASRLAAGQENHATIDERGLRIALALLAKSGGLFANEKSGEIMPDADLREVLTAITTLEISETPQTFEDRVNLAIDRAATQLLSQQENDGSFSGRYKTYPGGQALYLLALLDAGVPRDSAAIRKGISKLRSTSTLRAPTYAAGIILMMLQKYYEPEQEKGGMLLAQDKAAYEVAQKKVWKSIPGDDKRWIEDLLGLLTKHHHKDGWGYSRAEKEEHRDNSNSQYAVLGLKAASLLGAEFDRKIFLAEAERFIREYVSTGVVPIPVPRRGEDEAKKGTGVQKKKLKDITPGGWGYITGKVSGRTLSMSAAGVSSVMVCRDELKLAGLLEDDVDDELWRRVVGAMYQLGQNYPYQRPRVLESIPARSDGFGTLYDMYSVERAGVLSGLDYLDKVNWYVEGANILIDGQEVDGHWPVMKREGEYETVNHAFAILFLKRAAIHIADPPKRDRKPITGHARD